MLRFLRIRHLAVIDAAEIEFEPGFNALTGETGAGKSILVEAVGLLLGGRASADLVRTGEAAAAIEAIFEYDGEELVVRREITSQGRSRAFVNSALATAGALTELADRLVELHGQREHQRLLDPASHLAILDRFGSLERLTAATGAAYDALHHADRELSALIRAAADRKSREELVVFQLGELDRADPRQGEDEELAAHRRVLSSAERVERLCLQSYASLYESDGAILAGLGTIWRHVGELASLDSKFQPYLDARDGVKSQLEDLALFLRRYAESVESSPTRLQEVEERLALLERLKRKYGPTLAEVIDRRAALRREAEELARTDDRLADLQRGRDAARDRFLAAARALSGARRSAARDLSDRLERLLGELAMEHTTFEVRFGPQPLPEGAWTAAGIDAVEFFVSPNPGEEPRPLARIVSGGELSRIMLAIKTLTSRSRQGWTDAVDRIASAAAPGLIFDEVDAGIGGRVADVVGRTLRTLGSTSQVLCITHLPQVAAHADTHFQIEKRIEGGRTRTIVRRLDADGRVDEIARMLGGEAISDVLRASAREMLSARCGVPTVAGESDQAAVPEDDQETGRDEAKAKAPARGRKRK